MRRSIFVLALAVLTSILSVAAPVHAQGPTVQHSPVVTPATHHDTSPPLRSMTPARPQKGQVVHPLRPIPRSPHSPQSDPVLQRTAPALQIPGTSTNFNGVGNGFSGPQGTFTVASAPPDTNGDVGPGPRLPLDESLRVSPIPYILIGLQDKVNETHRQSELVGVEKPH